MDFVTFTEEIPNGNFIFCTMKAGEPHKEPVEKLAINAKEAKSFPQRERRNKQTKKLRKQRCSLFSSSQSEKKNSGRRRKMSPFSSDSSTIRKLGSSS